MRFRPVEGVLRALDEAIRQRGARIQLGRDWPTVLAYERWLRQILAHLLRNALLYVPAEREPEIVISAESDNGKAVLRVKDNGVGIPPDQINRAFRPFIRLPNSIKAPGTGMGLASVKKATERMNGRVGAESQPGQGRFLGGTADRDCSLKKLEP